MIQYGRQYLDGSDIAAVVKILKSDWLTQGPVVSAFEKALAEYCGAKYAVACSSGTSALHLSYLAAGLRPGDEAITTPNTFVATANMLLAAGAKPVFCDIRLDTYNIDESKIERLITGRTKAIVPVDFAGHPCALGKILKIAKKHNLTVIEDAAQGLGARSGRKKIGSIADMTTFSFHPVKSITTGEGGAVLTNRKPWADKMRLIRSHGVYKDKDGKNVMLALGYNYRITDVQCALGISQLKKLNGFIKKRHQVVKWYEKELIESDDIILPVEEEGVFAAWHIYVIRTKDPRDRDPLSVYLKERGIGVNFHYPAVYSHPYYRAHGYKNAALKNADVYHRSAITLPLHTRLSRKDVGYVAKTLRAFFR